MATQEEPLITIVQARLQWQQLVNSALLDTQSNNENDNNGTQENSSSSLDAHTKRLYEQNHPNVGAGFVIGGHNHGDENNNRAAAQGTVEPRVHDVIFARIDSNENTNVDSGGVAINNPMVDELDVDFDDNFIQDNQNYAQTDQR